MKSIIQESSSIAKAIEEAWKKADQPKEFSVKIFQEPKKNFFGFTKISAKIGFFFKDSIDNQNKYQKRDDGQVRRVSSNQSQGSSGYNTDTQGQQRRSGPGQGQQRPYRPYRQGYRKKTYGGFKPNLPPKDSDKS